MGRVLLEVHLGSDGGIQVSLQKWDKLAQDFPSDLGEMPLT